MKILVTGFKPFLGEKLNPSELLASDVARSFYEVTSISLPVEFGHSFTVLKDKVQNEAYDYVIMLGQAAGRNKVCFEKIALNWIESEYKDESGHRPNNGKIAENENLALMSIFPIDRVYSELKKQELPVEISFSAGTYVCNDLYFRMCSEFPHIESVFVHVPLIPTQIEPDKPRPSMEYNIQFKIITELIQVLLGSR